jgi:proton-dependent oligopeptide transporter, POT family
VEKIINQSHNKETFLYASSRMLERASYYGIRSIILWYMISGTLKMARPEASTVYAWFGASIVFSRIIGAILGDLVLGNKRTIIIGAIVQALGAFSLCIPSITGLYMGLLLVVLGGGLYTPNIISNFGKLYLDKTKLLDAGFTILHFAVNLGALLGTVTIAYVGEEYGWNTGFILAGIIMLLSIIPILFSKSKEIASRIENKVTTSQRVINISIAFLLIGAFWAIYEISNIQFLNIQGKLSEISTLEVPKSMWLGLSSAIILPLIPIAIILWTYYYSTQFFKLMIGFVFGAISFGILFLIPEIPNEQHTALYLISLFFLGVSEIYIAPVAYSVLTQYTNPKYLAILVSLAFIPTRLFHLIVGLFGEDLNEKPAVAILIGMIAMTIVSMVLIVYNGINKKPAFNSVDSK